MCGIAGARTSQPIPPARITACLALMKKRGPDASGFREFTHGNTVTTLLHSRLAIIDLDKRANQPFTRQGRHLICNGEIYSYRENCTEMREEASYAAYDGPPFQTESDTEVLFWGLYMSTLSDCVSQWLTSVEGMFAFAFYDEMDGSLFLGRDRFGEKPLYIYEDLTGLYFGSEVSFIEALIGHTLEPNLDHARRSLVNGYRSLFKTQETWYKGLRQVKSGTVLTIDASGKQQEHRYWLPRFQERHQYWLPPSAQEEDMTYEEAVAGTRERLFKSVELRLRADVPIAFCLSGGVDSTALISIAKKICGYDVHGFYVGGDDVRYDEYAAVRETAQTLSLRMTLLTPMALSGYDWLTLLSQKIAHRRVPLATSTYLIQDELYRRIHEEGYKVAVSGTAADELFGGYYDHYLLQFATAYAGFLESPHGRQFVLRAWDEKVLPHIRNPYFRQYDLFIKHPHFRDYLYLNADRYRTFLTEPQWNEPFTEEYYSSDMLLNRRLNEIFYETTPVSLHEDDLNAMSYGVENRSPFLDRDLAEFAWSIPARHLIKDGFNKAVLRDAVRDIAPAHVMQNPQKIGFNVGVEGLFDFKSEETQKMLLADGPVFSLVRRDKMKEALEQKTFDNRDSQFVFSFVNLKLWLEDQ